MADELAKPKLDVSTFSTEIPVGQAPGFRVIYINSSRMAVSPWDVRIVVGQVVEAGSGQQNQDEATLVMSPQHARQFLRSLEKTVNSYEEIFGPILDPMKAITAANEAAKEAAKEAGKASAISPKPQLRRIKAKPS